MGIDADPVSDLASRKKSERERREAGLTKEEVMQKFASSRSDKRAPNARQVFLVSFLAVILLAAILLIAISPRAIRVMPAPLNQTQAPATRASAFAAPAQMSVIAGEVIYTGQPVTPKTLSTASDPTCTAPVFSEDVVVNPDGSLANVLVYIKKGVDVELTASTPAGTVFVNSWGCRIEPHVLAVQAGQIVTFRNADASRINWRINGKLNPAGGYAQPMTGMQVFHGFTRPEIGIPLRDDIHPWKSGYICVLNHSFFNVTNTAGVFRISGLAPGTYIVESWHERLGTTQQTVTVGANELVKIKIKY